MLVTLPCMRWECQRAHVSKFAGLCPDQLHLPQTLGSRDSRRQLKSAKTSTLFDHGYRTWQSRFVALKPSTLKSFVALGAS